ncbi:hypothetical protein AA313_de0200288 [Arthrobotrys entomopaga]|nr:hypothetical protein AA313_de0200288 [Arthrobotrys entomopaga]
MILELEKAASGVSIFHPGIHEIIKQLHATSSNNQTYQDERVAEKIVVGTINTNIGLKTDTECPVKTIPTNNDDDDDTLWTDDPDNPTVSHRIYSINGIKVSNPKGWVSPTELRNGNANSNDGIPPSSSSITNNTSVVAQSAKI